MKHDAVKNKEPDLYQMHDFNLYIDDQVDFSVRLHLEYFVQADQDVCPDQYSTCEDHCSSF